MSRNPTRFWDFPSAAFLILILLTVGQRLSVTNWTWGLGTAIVLALIGVVLGLAIGFSEFKSRVVFWFTFGYSVPIVVLVLGWLLYREISWLERVADLSDRLAYSLGVFFKNQPVQDTLLFIIFMALVFWIVGLMAGYALTRYGNLIGAVMPAGVVLVIIQLYDPGNKSSESLLGTYFFLCLLLLGRLAYVQRRSYWKEQHVSLLTESKTELNIILAVVALASVVLVWLAPTSLKSFSEIKTEWENLTSPLQDVQRNLGHAVAGLKAGANVRTIEYFGDALPLGHQAATGDTVYLRIRTPIVPDAGRYYWRVRSYNIFLDDQWFAENVSNTSFTPDQQPLSLADPEGQTAEFAFTVLSTNLTTLVTPAHPVWVSYPSELYFLSILPGKVDPIQFRSDQPVLPGEQYYVRANVEDPTVVQLRDAGETYPGWVTRYYLQLPENLSPEIVALAQRITARAKTPYEMAIAITSYLRNNMTYSTTVEDPPAGQDPLDWFLFDSKSGFCNYFATAEVILLRSVGIPARMVVGFAEGELDPPDHYVVRQLDSHAWPEVFFPGIGWVEFEPTTSQAVLARPLGESLSSTGQLVAPTPTGPNVPNQQNAAAAGKKGIGIVTAATANLVLSLIFICTIIVSILRIIPYSMFESPLETGQRVAWRPLPVLLNRFFENRALTPPGWMLRWRYLAELDPIERSFTIIYRSLHWLGEKSSPAQTPAEAATALARLLPDVSQEIYSLLHEYQRHLYSQLHGYLPLARRAVRVIRQKAMRAAIQQRWNALRGILRLGHA